MINPEVIVRIEDSRIEYLGHRSGENAMLLICT